MPITLAYDKVVSVSYQTELTGNKIWGLTIKVIETVDNAHQLYLR